MQAKSLLVISILILFFICTNSRKEDIACRGILCIQGYRCSKGSCVTQQIQALKKVCVKPQFDGKIEAQKCLDKDRSSKCTQAKNVLSCGFGFNGLRYDFTNDCSPCLDPKVFFYYRLPCSVAPAVCKQYEQCINGKCVEMFDTDNGDDRNRIICNQSKQCENDEFCVANKCVGKQELLIKLREGKGKNQ